MDDEEQRYEDIIFDWPDGRQTCVTITKDGRFRGMEKPAGEHATWGPPTEGWVVK